MFGKSRFKKLRSQQTLPEGQELVLFVGDLYVYLLKRPPTPDELDTWVGGLSRGESPYAVMRAFIESEEFQRVNAVRLFVPPGHFYSPIVDPSDAESRLLRADSEAALDSLPGIAIDHDGMVEVWGRLLRFLSDVPFETAPGKGFQFGFENPAYSWGDASVLHAMLRLYRPARFIEIGSGWSSACAVDTVSHYLDGCDLTFIEPRAELLRKLLGAAVESVRILESRVQEVPLEIFRKLQAGDILFIDSTHVLRTGSDVCFELFEILPNLAPGVLVHFHDMFWPFEYPREWVLDENRSWNELYAVRAFLTNNDQWRVLFFNDYFARFERRRIEETFPRFLRNSGGALWIAREG